LEIWLEFTLGKVLLFVLTAGKIIVSLLGSVLRVKGKEESRIGEIEKLFFNAC
jgi:hypothetical protein